jgi:hypothetical protein
MNPFVERYQKDVVGVLSCFDRVIVTGTLPDICHPKAMAGFLGAHNIRLFDYALWAAPLREELRANAERVAAEAGLTIMEGLPATPEHERYCAGDGGERSITLLERRSRWLT